MLRNVLLFKKLPSYYPSQHIPPQTILSRAAEPLHPALLPQILNQLTNTLQAGNQSHQDNEGNS